MATDTTKNTGYDWLQRFMEAQASVAGNSMFFTFKLGQIGVLTRAGNVDQALARSMLDDLRTDREDLAKACGVLVGVMDGLIANIERNIGDGA